MDLIVYRLKSGEIIIMDYYKEDECLEELEGLYDFTNAEEESISVKGYTIIEHWK